jgi:hypothetical protein
MAIYCFGPLHSSISLRASPAVLSCAALCPLFHFLLLIFLCQTVAGNSRSPNRAVRHLHFLCDWFEAQDEFAIVRACFLCVLRGQWRKEALY